MQTEITCGQGHDEPAARRPNPDGTFSTTANSAVAIFAEPTPTGAHILDKIDLKPVSD